MTALAPDASAPPHPPPLGDGPPRLTLPAPPAPAPATPFPLLATCAPVVMSLAIWAVTQSVFALLFAALGPLIAIASTVDSRIHRRGHERTERRRYADQLDACRAEIRRLHIAERAARSAAAPRPLDLLRTPRFDPDRWRSTGAPARLAVGRARLPSALRVSPDPALGEPAEATALRRAAAEVDDVPLVADAADGVGVIGSGPAVSALVRALLCQLALRVPPSGCRVHRPADEHEWLDGLPHEVVIDGDGEVSLAADGELLARIAWGESSAELARRCRVLVRVDDRGARLARHPSRDDQLELEPDFVSEADARGLAAELAAVAADEGLLDAAALPAVLSYADLPRGPAPTGGLAAVVGLGIPRQEEGERMPSPARIAPVVLDLVRDGPHALIGGTTGSGKSELLTTWVLGMAQDRPPEEVTFLLVDFKGGATFAPLEALPHVVGVLTDLDDATADRALSSLRAELRHRERALAERGLRSIDDDGAGLPRLVIVIDEFAALIERFPDLQALIADIAARGRSLGVHLVLCTQRPAGVVRDAVLANVDLRLSLRVTAPADSLAVLGSPAAAELPADPRGRAIVARAGRAALVQFAIASADDIRAVRGPLGRHRAADVRRPWLPPLAPSIPVPTTIEPGAIPLGLRDLPERQLHETALWRPALDGHLLAVGGPRSGKSTLLDTVAAGAATGFALLRPAARLPEVWDAVDAALRALAAGSRHPLLVLIDDVDAVLGAADDEYGHELADRLTRLLREGPGAGVSVVLTAMRLTGALHSLAALCPVRLVLRLPTRQEHALVTGGAAGFDPALPPGGGLLDGARVQVGLSAAPRPHPTPIETAALPARGDLAVVSARPEIAAAALQRARPDAVVSVLGAAAPGITADAVAGAPGSVRASHGGPVVMVGDPDSWSADWGSLPALAQRHPVVVEGCTPAEFRAVTRSRVLPPPCPPGQTAWLRSPDGSVHRLDPSWRTAP